MKRFLFAGLILCLLTLLSCSRKKQEPSQTQIPTGYRAETPGGDDFEWIEEETEEQNLTDRINRQFSDLSITNKRIKDGSATSELNTLPEANTVPEPEVQSQEEPELSSEDEAFAAEEERLGTDVLNYLENESNFTSPITQTDVPDSDSVPEVETVEKRLVDAYSRLKIMEFESELFVPSP